MGDMIEGFFKRYYSSILIRVLCQVRYNGRAERPLAMLYIHCVFYSVIIFGRKCFENVIFSDVN